MAAERAFPLPDNVHAPVPIKNSIALSIHISRPRSGRDSHRTTTTFFSGPKSGKTIRFIRSW